MKSNRHAVDANPEQYETILATIIILQCYEKGYASTSSWRLHIRGGQQWLESTLGQQRNKSTTRTILESLFQILKGLANTHVINELSDSDVSSLNPKIQDEPQEDSVFEADERAIFKEEVYGITKSVWDYILETNRLMKQRPGPSPTQIASLELKVMQSNPSAMPIPAGSDANSLIEKMMWHHRITFYFASVIHFRRSLQQVSSSQLQHLVENAQYHFEAIEVLEAEVGSNGIFWPLFMVACEANDENLRERSFQLLWKGGARGIGNIIKAVEVVREVWRRRDQAYPPHEATSRQVMKDLGLDLTLA